MCPESSRMSICWVSIGLGEPLVTIRTGKVFGVSFSICYRHSLQFRSIQRRSNKESGPHGAGKFFWEARWTSSTTKYGCSKYQYRRGPGKYARNCNGMTNASNTMCSLSSVLCQSLAGIVEVMWAYSQIRSTFSLVWPEGFYKIPRINAFFAKQFNIQWRKMCIQFLLLACVWCICILQTTFHINLYTCIFTKKCMQSRSRNLYLHCALYMFILQLLCGFHRTSSVHFPC